MHQAWKREIHENVIVLWLLSSLVSLVTNEVI